MHGFVPSVVRGRAADSCALVALARVVGRRLSRRFFARDADVVARDLLGRILVHEPAPGARVSARIVETEAYFGPARRNPHLARRDDMPPALRARLLAEGDAAAHSFSGVTQRNRVMYGAPGFAYVYLIYGMHECMNIVTGPARDHEPQAVLLRAGEPLDGVELMRARRPAARRDTDIASGPAKLAAALGITRAQYGLDLCAPDAPLYVEAGRAVTEAEVAVTPRINVVGAEDLPLRYLVKENAHVSRRV